MEYDLNLNDTRFKNRDFINEMNEIKFIFIRKMTVKIFRDPRLKISVYIVTDLNSRLIFPTTNYPKFKYDKVR